MPHPVPTFSALIERLVEHEPDLAYVHLIEPRISAGEDSAPLSADESNDFARALWSPRPLILTGGFDREKALKEAEKGSKNVLVGVGRQFTSNPDLVGRWMKGVEVRPYEKVTFYTKGAKGYSDWAFAEDVVE